MVSYGPCGQETSYYLNTVHLISHPINYCGSLFPAWPWPFRCMHVCEGLVGAEHSNIRTQTRVMPNDSVLSKSVGIERRNGIDG